MKPTLYDILGVRPDAKPDEIKRAWRDAADRFEPGSGSSGAQFRLFNEAAEVLLDPARRRQYDEELGADQSARVVEPKVVEPKPVVEPFETVASRPPEGPPVETSPAADRPRRAAPPTWLMVALGALAVVLVAVVAWLGLRTWDIREVRHHDQVTAAGSSAPGVAERAAAVILSYDYRSLGSDEKAAERYMTPKYAKTYASTFRLVQANAPKLHAHVEAAVRGSGVTTADPDRVNVLLFVDQTTVSTANDGQKQTALNRVGMKMVRQNGTWLVDDITSY